MFKAFVHFIQVRQLAQLLGFQKITLLDHGQDIVKSCPLLQPIRLQEIKKYHEACTNKKIKIFISAYDKEHTRKIRLTCLMSHIDTKPKPPWAKETPIQVAPNFLLFEQK